MKKILQLFLVLLIFSLMSCDKEEQVSFEKTNEQISNSLSNNEGTFKEDIVITDESGKNSAFFAVYSDDKNLLSAFLEANEFSLLINEDDIATLKSAKTSDLKQTKSSSNEFDLNQEPQIIIDLITDNLQENVESYSLNIKQKNSKTTKDFIYGYPVAYTTSNNFIGAVHYGDGYEFVAKIEYKSEWYSSWKYLTINGANAWFIYPASIYYISYSKSPSYKLGLVIYPHYYQKTINYKIAYSRDNFRGRNCTIGGYDGRNCYVGTPPNGTTAFIYSYPGNESGNFYYSAVNGNQCPYPGSYFDGANCFVLDIPSTCSGFIYQNNWYVKADIIN